MCSTALVKVGGNVQMSVNVCVSVRLRHALSLSTHDWSTAHVTISLTAISSFERANLCGFVPPCSAGCLPLFSPGFPWTQRWSHREKTCPLN